MFLSLTCGSKEITHNKILMIGLQTYQGMRAIYENHININLILKPGTIFILLDKGEMKYNIGNSFLQKTRGNIFLISNFIDSSYNKIQPELKKTWNDILENYKKEEKKPNWFEDNKDKVNELVQK